MGGALADDKSWFFTFFLPTNWKGAPLKELLDCKAILLVFQYLLKRENGTKKKLLEECKKNAKKFVDM
ncbi:MAG: hypothetical protein D6B28_00625 [Gammaproteobacteria bacterium]|nr:MAG: hypothetical protein D6B28_00625 [Gammaproteobacteria bacterium]